MSEEKFDRFREQLTVPVPPPPADLAAKLKGEIPDLRATASSARGASFSDHPALWRLAASVIMIFGFTYIAVRMFLLSSNDHTFMAEMKSAPEPVAHSASDSRLPDGALAEAPQENIALSADDAAQSQPSAPPMAAAKPATRPRMAVAQRSDRGQARDLAANEETRRERDTTTNYAYAPEVAAAAPPPPPPAAAPSAAAAPADAASAEGRIAEGERANQLRPQVTAKASRQLAGATEKKKELARVDCVEPKLAKRVSGVVVVSFEVGKDGSVSDVKVLRGLDARTDAAVIAAVEKWKYSAQPEPTSKTVAINAGRANCAE
jgi:TonB family protein